MGNDNYIKWKPLAIIITILFALIMASFTLAGNALTKANGNSGDIKAVQTNIEWIKDSLERIEDKLEI